MKQLLVVTGQFPPSATMGAQRPLRLVRRIQEFGWQAQVLTLPARCMYPLDYHLGQDVLSSLQVERVPCRSIWQHSTWWKRHKSGLPRIMAVVGRALAKFTEPLIPIDELYPWALFATSRGISLVKQRGIDLIYSTAPKLSYLYLAGRISHKTGVPYVVDFRDVTMRGDEQNFSAREKKQYLMEQKIIRDAAGLIYVAPGQRDILFDKYPFINDKPTSLIHNWFETNEVQSCPPRQFEYNAIIHGGNLTRGNTLKVDGFLDGLKIYFKKCSDNIGNVKFHHYGPSRDIIPLAHEAEIRHLEEVVHAGTSLTRSEYLSVCRGADILLLVVGRDVGTMQHAQAIPGKLYDYLAACRPILVVGPPGCEAGKMVMRLNRGLSVSDDDPNAIADAIDKLLQENGSTGKLDLSPGKVQEFEASTAVRKMADFFNLVYEKSGK
jgi:hypothetical protein